MLSVSRSLSSEHNRPITNLKERFGYNERAGEKEMVVLID